MQFHGVEDLRLVYIYYKYETKPSFSPKSGPSYLLHRTHLSIN
jgi:hypothetical protein